MVLIIDAAGLSAQIRRNVVTDLNGTERQLLFNLILDYIDEGVVEQHCHHQAISGGHIHSDFDFLPFHRMYIEGLEDYLIMQDHPEFVPLPKWDPEVDIPNEFRTGGAWNNGVDEVCATAMCMDMDMDPVSANWCASAMSWFTWPIPDFLRLEPELGNYNDLCDWHMEPTFPDPGPQLDGNCCPTGLSEAVEGQSGTVANYDYHNSLHQIVASAMRNTRSPSAPIFWIWHALVDDIWKEWECNCSNSTLDPVDLYMKDTPMVVESERDRGEEPNIDPGPIYISTDIWVRNQDDGGSNREHQNPEYSPDPQQNSFVYVQVRNRGCSDYTGAAALHLYWSKGGTSLGWPMYWDGSVTDPALMGEEIGSITLPLIPAGGSKIFSFAWHPENPATYAAIGGNYFWQDEPWHFCLLARIVGNDDPMTFTESDNVFTNAKNNNNIVTKNVSVVEVVQQDISNVPGLLIDKPVGATIIVGDPFEQGGTYDLVFANPSHYKGNPVTAEAEVRVTLQDDLWDLWQQSGAHATNFRVSVRTVIY